MLCSSHPRLHSASPKNVPGPIRAAPRSRSPFVNLKNIHKPIRSLLHRRPHAASRKNVLGPILEPHLSSTHCVDRKNVRGPIAPLPSALTGLRNLKTVHRPIRMSFRLSARRWPTGEMFLDLSGSHVKPLIEYCQPGKYSWSYPELSGTAVRLGHCRAGD